MARLLFFVISITSLILIFLIHFIWPHVLYFLILVVPYTLLGLFNVFGPHNVLRNYPVIGYLRYLFEFIRPEIQQYFVATNLSGRPYNREQRNLVYARAHNETDTHPFGTEHDITDSAYAYAHHSMQVKTVPETGTRVNIGEHHCTQPYSASRINISAMSFGALSNHAVQALNRGAHLAGCYQNTGEGGLTEYHLKEGGDITWQIGTGYFGCRTEEGHFDPDKFKAKAQHPHVKMIEVKISQGAKPSHGGVLPAAKITPEIATIRGIPLGKDCLSPPMHTAFTTPIGLLEFIAQLRELSGGKPVGFKLTIGRRGEFMSICKAMLETGITPDFITVDGAEGGTGAAPLEFSNRLGKPIDEALAFVHNCLVGTHLRDKVRVIASGKIVTGFDVVKKIAMGADICNIARGFMFSVGCIQALRCHTNTCPTGVTTQDPRRTKALVIAYKGPHAANFHRNTLKSVLELIGAMGVDHPDHLNPNMIFYRMNEGMSVSYSELFHYLQPGQLLYGEVPEYYKDSWESCSADSF